MLNYFNLQCGKRNIIVTIIFNIDLRSLVWEYIIRRRKAMKTKKVNIFGMEHTFISWPNHDPRKSTSKPIYWTVSASSGESLGTNENHRNINKISRMKARGEVNGIHNGSVSLEWLRNV